MVMGTSEVRANQSSVGLVWHLLGLRSSLDLRLCLVFFIPACLNPLFVDRAMYGGSLWFWFAILIPSHIIFTVAILCFRNLIHRGAPDASHPVQTLLAYFVCQGLRGAFIGLSLVESGLTDNPNFQFRIGTGGILVSTILSVIAVSMAVLDQHTATVQELELRQHELMILRDSMETRIEQATLSLRQFVAETVSAKILEITQMLEVLKSGGDKSTAIITLQKYVDDELRPLSHQLAHGRSLLDEIRLETLKVKRFALPASIDLARSLRPNLTSLLFLLPFAGVAARTMGPQHSVLFDIPCLVFLLLYFNAAKAFFVGRIISRNAGIFLGLVVYGLTGPIIISLMRLLVSSVPAHVSTPSTILGLVYGLANLMYTIATAQRDELANQLQTTILALSQSVALLRQREWIARRRITLVVHGSLQSSLNAAVLKLGAASEINSKMIDIIRSDIQHALDRIHQDQIISFSFPATQSELSHMWFGTLEIEWHVDLATYRALNANPATSECLGEVVREALGNAARHGSATKSDVRIEVANSIVLVRVSDNGHGTNAGITHGLGVELFNDVCTKWSLERSPEDGMVLSAQLPLAA